MKEMTEKLKDILGEKYFIFGECMTDSLIRIDEIGTGVHTCRECTVADIVREDMIGTVFCPLMMKRDLEFRVKWEENFYE